MQKGNRHTEHEQLHGSAHHKGRPQCQQLSANSVNHETYHRADHRRFTRKHSRPRWDRTVPLKLGTPTTIEDVHNAADMKNSVYPVVKVAARPKDGEHLPKLINLPREKQIYICVNEKDCDTAYSK